VVKSADPIDFALPGTSANLGPAFDSAAIALKLHLRVAARVADRFSIQATGRDAETCESRENNLLVDTYFEVLDLDGVARVPLSIRIENEIPIGKGCGSSAAALLGGILLATHFGGLDWDNGKILAEAAKRERHADNVAACWLGGLVICSENLAGTDGYPGPALTSFKITPQAWPILLIVPEETLPTSKSRNVLPDKYSRSDVVTNIQNSMFLIAAFAQSRPDLLRVAMRDKMHEAYREPLCPLLSALRPLSETPGVAGMALSGAGPSVLLVLQPDANQEQIERRIRQQLSLQKISAEVIHSQIEDQGTASSFALRKAVR
jgi:homoserine kinase